MNKREDVDTVSLDFFFFFPQRYDHESQEREEGREEREKERESI